MRYFKTLNHHFKLCSFSLAHNCIILKFKLVSRNTRCFSYAATFDLKCLQNVSLYGLLSNKNGDTSSRFCNLFVHDILFGPRYHTQLLYFITQTLKYFTKMLIWYDQSQGCFCVIIKIQYNSSSPLSLSL